MRLGFFLIVVFFMSEFRELNQRLEERVADRTAAIEGEVAEQKRAEEAPRKAHDELEIRVQERTAELAKANEALRAEIAERNQIEMALRESEEPLRLVAEGVKDYAIFMLDAGGYIVSWNAGAEHIKGYKSEKIIGKHFSIFYPQEDIEHGRLQHNLDIAVAEGHYEDEGWRVRKDGSRFWANVVITALRDEYGNLRGFSKVTRDITERKRITEEEIHNPQSLGLLGMREHALLFGEGSNSRVVKEEELQSPCVFRLKGKRHDQNPHCR